MTLDPTRSNLGGGAVPGSESLAGIEAPHRGPVFGARYAVATDHPLASLAAMNVMQRGGNAIDATIAAAAVNVVTKPHRTHLGGDAFALVWRRRTNEVDCLNAGGLAPRRATLDQFPNGIPDLGPRAVSVPGFVDALLEMHRTYATLSLDVLFAPAIRLAEEGFPVSMRLSGAMELLAADKEPYSTELRRLYLKNGREPHAPGETLRLPELAGTLRRIVEDGRDGFYAGETAAAITKAFAGFDGLIDAGDLEKPLALWHEPLRTTYAGCDVYEQALPSQGIILLEALNIVENFPLADWGLGSVDANHVMVEATKLAFADSRRYATDPLVETAPVERLLSKEHARARAAEIDLKRAKTHAPAMLRSDTTELVAGDEEFGVAFIQSVFSPWGSRFAIPRTGIAMNNRLRGFHTDPASPNVLAPGKRTVHTLNTFLALRDGKLALGGGTPGGDFQVQSNLQSLVGVLNWDLDLQSAIDMPRWVTLGDDSLNLEGRFPTATLDELRRRGHDVKRLADWDATLCRIQLLASTAEGGWAAGSDLRGEGLALGW